MNSILRIVTASLLLTLACGIAGCEAFSFFTQTFATEVDAKYKLPNRPTLVLVDDPQALLGDPSLERVLATRVGFHLVQEGVVTEIVSPDRVAELATKLGPGYVNAPLDQIGRAAGAKQVINVYVEQTDFRVEEGTYRPGMLVRVKVVDTSTGTRLFPAADATASGDLTTSANGYPVASQLFYKIGVGEGTDDVATAVRAVVERSGRDVSRLFYKYTPRQPGEKFDD